MASTITPNMNLIVPTVSQEPGPTYATDINTSLSTIDTHDHTSGKGVTITPLGLNINSDLTFGGNNQTAVRSLRFTAQGTPISNPSDVGALYEAGVDLYYNDGSGNQIRLTQSGGIAGTPGSISSLVSPASATYVAVSQKFVWQSAVNTAANLDAGSLIMRNITAGSNALTLSPPSGLASNYTITLPTLPASQSFMTIDNTGAVAAPAVYPLTSAGIASQTITGSNVASSTIQRANLVSVGQVQSSSTAGYTTTATTAQDVLTLSITTTGRPVVLMVQGAGTSNSYIGTIETTQSGAVNIKSQFVIERDGTTVTQSTLRLFTQTSQARELLSPPGSLNTLDTGAAAGTHVYKLKAFSEAAGITTAVNNCTLYAYEL